MFLLILVTRRARSGQRVRVPATRYHNLYHARNPACRVGPVAPPPYTLHVPTTQEQHLMDSKLPVVSLFSGAGGLDLAVEFSGGTLDEPEPGPLRVAVATDYEADALTTLSENFPEVPTVLRDIRQLPTAEILEVAGLRKGEPALIIGGPPCTPFSKSGFWVSEKRESKDPNASLLDEFVRVVAESSPEAFILENVQGLTYSTHQKQFKRLLKQLEELGYNPRYQVLLAAEYGVPQLRRRVFVVGRRDGASFAFPPTTHSGISERDRTVDPTKFPFVTAKEAIGNLLPGIPEPGEVVEGQYADLAAEVPPGQNYLWHTDRYGGRNKFKWRSRYWTFLLRLDPDRPATTLQAQPGPWVGPFHWENVTNEEGQERARRLRVPEILRLMTFPDSFKVPTDRVTIQRQLGNAVPMKLGQVVVRELLAQLGYLEAAAVPDASSGQQLELLT